MLAQCRPSPAVHIMDIRKKSARRQLRSIRETPNPNQNATVLDNIQVRGAADEMKLRPEIVQ